MNNSLTFQQAYDFQNSILQGQIAKDELINFFKQISQRQLTIEEFNGFISASRANMIKVNHSSNCLDIVGTGGDQLNTFNISTAASIVCAAGGVSVAKHGNRAASSKCGSADVLEALGVKINLNPDSAKVCLEKAGIVFLFAPNFHPAFRYASEARKEFGQRTYFNFLGPLLNPASPRYQVVGVSDAYMKSLMREIIQKSEIENAMLVRSNEGMDELSTLSTNSIEYLKQHSLQTLEVDPQKLNLQVSEITDLQGGDAELNAKIINNIFANQATKAQSEIVILNAAAGLIVANLAENFESAVQLAREIIVSGRAQQKLTEFIKVSNEL